MYKAFLQNKRWFFWVLQTIGWLAYISLNYFQGQSSGATADCFYTTVFYALAGSTHILGLRYVNKSIREFSQARPSRNANRVIRASYLAITEDCG